MEAASLLFIVLIGACLVCCGGMIWMMAKKGGKKADADLNTRAERDGR